MGLFTRSRRKPKNPQNPEGPRSRGQPGSGSGPPQAASILSALSTLQGSWQGIQRLYDPDYGDFEDLSAAIGIELSPERTHLILHHRSQWSDGIEESFDALGLDETGTELVNTHFTDSRHRQVQQFRVTHWRVEKKARAFQLVMQTTGWDEGRPCEIEWRFELASKQLRIHMNRCLINSEESFSPVRVYSLTRR